MIRRRALPLAFTALLLTASAFAFSPRPNPPTPREPTPPPPPTAAEYAAALEGGSYTSVHYEIVRCARIGAGYMTTAHAIASTSSGSVPSGYLGHNVQLFIDGLLVGRSPDVERRVPYPSPTNFITSLPPVRVSVELSCPRALVAAFESAGWHKGVSIHGHARSVTTRATFHG